MSGDFFENEILRVKLRICGIFDKIGEIWDFERNPVGRELDSIFYYILQANPVEKELNSIFLLFLKRKFSGEEIRFFYYF